MIKYIKGDITNPIREPNKRIIIPHVCNNCGKFARGIALAISKKWIEAKIHYECWYQGKEVYPKFELGQIQSVEICKEDIWIVNMIAQDGLISKYNKRPVKYNHLKKCLKQVGYLGRLHKASVHMAKIGSGLGGGNWDFIECIIQETLNDLDVVIYELE